MSAAGRRRRGHAEAIIRSDDAVSSSISPPPFLGRPQPRTARSNVFSPRSRPPPWYALVALGMLLGLVLGVRIAHVGDVEMAAASISDRTDGPAASTKPIDGDGANNAMPKTPEARRQSSRESDRSRRSREVNVRDESAEHSPGMSSANTSSSEFSVGASVDMRGNYTNPGMESMLRHGFSNEAVEREVRTHDRWVIESLAFLGTFDRTATEAYAQHQARASSSPKPITLVILTVNRRVPYLAVLVSTLLRGNDPSALMENVELHIVNIERRPGRERYYLLEELRDKLTFAHFHDWTARYSQHLDLEKPYLADQRLDYVRSLRLCEKSGSRWCVVMEDDAALCANFVKKFRRYVDRDVFPNASSDGAEDVALDRIAMVKLFNPFNPGVRVRWDEPRTKRQKRLALSWNETHELMLYNDNRAEDWPQTRAIKRRPPVRKIDYRVESVREWWSVVANAYPSIGLNRTIAFLESEDSRRGRPTDVALCKNFLYKENLTQLGVVPSLANHIGFYSENLNDNWKAKGISTDVRFQLDDGST